MSKNETPTKVIVPCRFSYLHCWEPEAINGGEPKYSVSAIIPKSDKETIKKIQAAVEAAKQESLSKWGGKIPPNLKLPLRDGDIDIYSDDGKESIAPEVTLQNGETVGAADWLFLITNYADKRGRYCFRMDEILDPETVSSVSAFGETFSIE